MTPEPTINRPTSAAQWAAAAAGELYILPGSGNAARLRRPSLIALASTTNGIPNPVLRLLAIEGTKEQMTDEERLAAYKRQARAFLEVAALAFVEPQLVLDRPADIANGEIGPDLLVDQDLLWIYYDLTEGSAARLLQFRADYKPDTARADGTAAALSAVAARQ